MTSIYIDIIGIFEIFGADYIRECTTAFIRSRLFAQAKNTKVPPRFVCRVIRETRTRFFRSRKALIPQNNIRPD